MKKSLSRLALLLLLASPAIHAQTISGGASIDSSTETAPPKKGDAGKPGAAASPSGPTIIDSDSMDYDEKTRRAIFTGDDYGVKVTDPSFTIYCDKLTAVMRKTGADAAAPGAKASPGAKSAPSTAPSPAAKGGKADAAASKGSGLESALAEGTADRPVYIIKVEPATNGQQPQRDVGIALVANYNAVTGDVVLTGWPRVSQNGDTQIATSPRTTMTMNRNTNRMTTKGPSRTVIDESEQSKKPAADGGSSPSSTP